MNQLIPCAHSGYRKQQQHKPWVYDILKCILILHIRKWSDHSKCFNSIEHINNMIQNHKHNCDPSDIVYV